MALSAGDYENLLKIIEILNSLPDRNDMLQAVCEWLQKTLRLSSAVLVPADPQTGQFQFEKNFLFNGQAKDLLQYVLYYAPLDPLASDGWIWRYDNTVAQFTDFVSPLQIADSEFGRDFLPQVPMFYCLCATFGSQGDPIGALGLHRKRRDRDFTDRDKEIVRLLAPHLSKTLHNLSLMDAIAGCQEVGIIVIRSDGTPAYMNQEAKRALGGKPIGIIPDPGLRADGVLFRTETGAYRVRTVPPSGARASIGEDIALTINPHSRPKRGVKVILLEPVPARWKLKTRLGHLGLSPRQEEIASLVLQGFSNREIAERLFICEQTVKDHLHDIFEKIQVRRRSELTAKILGLSIP